MWIVCVIVVVLVVIFALYNKLTKLRMRVRQSKSGIDVYLQQRFDLIPNLVEVVKQYTNYERETLERIGELRALYNQNKDIKLSEELNDRIEGILIDAENYPELKANEQFLNLQRNLIKIESQLQAARRIYNGDVTAYNIQRQTIPYNIIAAIFGFKEETMFEIKDQSVRNNVNVNINGGQA